MRDLPETLLAALRSQLGSESVSTDLDTLAERGHDMWPLALVQEVLGQAPNRPLAVVRPTSAGAVAQALRSITEHGIAVVPYGGGSGVVAGARAPTDSVVLDVGRLDQILALDEDDLMVSVQAGVRLDVLEAYLSERGYTTGHYPQSIALAQVGGLVATRSCGQFSTKYGGIEDMVAGLEAALPDGELVRVRPAPRRSVGPDLRQIWIGSEGTLGVITEVTLKIVPLPAERRLQAYAIASLAQGLDALRRFMRIGWRPAVVRLHDAIEAKRHFGDIVHEGEAILLLLCEGPTTYADAELVAIDEIVQAAGGRALGPDPVRAWLEHRNDISHYERYLRSGLVIDTIEVAAGWHDIARIYAEVSKELPRQVPELQLLSAHSSHSYPQGTNLYFSIAAKPPRDPSAAAAIYERIWATVMEITLAMNGTIAHHHGIGRLRASWVPSDLGSSYRVLEAIEHAIDPHGLMNPGALLAKRDKQGAP